MIKHSITRSLVAMFIAGAAVAVVGAQQAPAPNTWAIDSSHSAARFAVRHMMVSTVRGTLGPVSGGIVYDGKNLSSIVADVSIDVKGLSTGDERRDAHLRTPDFFAADQYPNIRFKSTRVVAGAGGAFKLIGDLTIRDVTKSVTLDVEPLPTPVTSRGWERTAATATTTINRFDYNLKWNSLIETGGAVVGPDVQIVIDLEVTRR